MKVQGVSLVLIIILLMNAFGFNMLFNITQNNIRKEIRARIRDGLNDSELVTFEFINNNSAEIQWIHPGKEFVYRNGMYDIVKSKQLAGKTVYYCINDIKEKRLIDDFSRRQESNPKMRILAGLFITSYLINNGIELPFDSCRTIHYTIGDDGTLSKIREIADPPPKSKMLS